MSTSATTPWTTLPRSPARLAGVLLVGILLPGSLCLGPIPAAADDGSRSVDRTFPAKARGELEVRIAAGRLTIVGEDRRTIALSGSLGADLGELDVFHDGRYLRVTAVPPGVPGDAPSRLASDLTFRVPTGTELRLQSAEADVRVEGVQGRVHLEGGVGTVGIVGAPRSIYAVTVSGDLELEVESPDVELKTVGGSISVAGDVESLVAETVSAPLRVSAGIGVEGRLRTVTGAIDFTGVPASTARLRIESSSGAVGLELDPELGGRFEVSTARGELVREPPDAWDGLDLREEKGRRAARRARGDEPRRIEIHTLDGSVHLRSKGDSAHLRSKGDSAHLRSKGD